MQNEETYFRLKEVSKYEMQPYASVETRKALLERVLTRNPKLDVRGGTQLTNPYKPIYDLVISEKLARIELLKESKLWSPRFSPSVFKYFFLPTMATGISLILYLHYIQIPKRMLFLKQKKGFLFRELEAKGWLNGWILSDYKDDIYEDEILKDFEELTNSMVTQPGYKTEEELKKEELSMHKTRRAAERAKMDVKLNELYVKRKREDLI